ncbi:hypothetical protein LCGC14_0309860, partial [marine sediment metagenome]
ADVTPAKKAIARPWRRLYRQNEAQLTLEWTMVLAFVALPMYFIFKGCFRLLVAHFQMVSFMQTIPFP